MCAADITVYYYYFLGRHLTTWSLWKETETGIKLKHNASSGFPNVKKAIKLQIRVVFKVELWQNSAANCLFL